ncbi:GNAT family N-acetyltransferase [Chitinophaga tropicalis]|uniref:GNAT family N-acetyltransferase n=1 Tax=Chitinophaga tropicalis TaxID=2683588 RepID=A0A7K1U457_9BACT|nr:GNAT family N-acetyltransferase [Chitinophaga tropicalis]MVT09076.1 GNAT family N-acetyltransferase [Chitinophaga tropicalis]
MTAEKEIKLRHTESADLEQLFQFQLDREACYLAAFMPEGHADKTAFIKKWTGFLTNPEINMRTILVDDRIAGSVAKFVMHGDAEITYWIDRELWGQGIASNALMKLLEVEKTRPIFGRVAFDNFGSQRVLEKCGFVKIGNDRGFASARQMEIEEYIYKLI